MKKKSQVASGPEYEPRHGFVHATIVVKPTMDILGMSFSDLTPDFCDPDSVGITLMMVLFAKGCPVNTLHLTERRLEQRAPQG